MLSLNCEILRGGGVGEAGGVRGAVSIEEELPSRSGSGEVVVVALLVLFLLEEAAAVKYRCLLSEILEKAVERMRLSFSLCFAIFMMVT